MDKYVIFAWLPGTSNVGLKNQDGVVGYWNPSFGFIEMSENFKISSIHKYGYRPVPEQTVTLSTLQEVVEKLNASLDR